MPLQGENWVSSLDKGRGIWKYRREMHLLESGYRRRLKDFIFKIQEDERKRRLALTVFI